MVWYEVRRSRLGSDHDIRDYEVLELGCGPYKAYTPSVINKFLSFIP